MRRVIALLLQSVVSLDFVGFVYSFVYAKYNDGQKKMKNWQKWWKISSFSSITGAYLKRNLIERIQIPNLSFTMGISVILEGKASMIISFEVKSPLFNDVRLIGLHCMHNTQYLWKYIITNIYHFEVIN